MIDTGNHNIIKERIKEQHHHLYSRPLAVCSFPLLTHGPISHPGNLMPMSPSMSRMASMSLSSLSLRSITRLCIRSPRSQMGGRSSRILVDLERVNEPVRLREDGGVISDEVCACGCLGGAVGRAPDVAGPVAAEGYIEDLRQLAYCAGICLLWVGGGKDLRFYDPQNANQYHTHRQTSPWACPNRPDSAFQPGYPPGWHS